MKVTAQVQRSGDWWAIEVPEVPGVFTQAKRLEHVADTVADAVATMLDDVTVDDVQVDVQPVLPAGVANQVAEASRLAVEATTAAAAASSAMRLAARKLREEHLSVRDAALVLGVSHQRVSQLVESAAGVVVAPTRNAGGSIQVFDTKEAALQAGRAAASTKRVERIVRERSQSS
jgi:predicted transcriptional regulator/predicted RNase H-like HicB family nuclease